MGNLQANISKQVFSEFTQYINENANNIVNRSGLICTSGNTLAFQTGGEQYCDFICTNCDFKFDQRATTQCQISAQNLNQIQTDIKNNIKNQVEQFAKQGSKNVQDFLATAFSFQINGVTNITQLSNLIQNSIRTDIQNFCENQMLTNNNAIIKLCGAYNSLTFSLAQDAFTTGVANCVNKNIISAFTNNDTLNQIIQKTDQALLSEQKGISSALMWIAIIGGIILLLLIVGAVIWFFLSRGSGSTTQIYASGYGQPQQPIGTGPLGALQFAQSVL